MPIPSSSPLPLFFVSPFLYSSYCYSSSPLIPSSSSLPFSIFFQLFSTPPSISTPSPHILSSSSFSSLILQMFFPFLYSSHHLLFLTSYKFLNPFSDLAPSQTIFLSFLSHHHFIPSYVLCYFSPSLPLLFLLLTQHEHDEKINHCNFKVLYRQLSSYTTSPICTCIWDSTYQKVPFVGRLHFELGGSKTKISKHSLKVDFKISHICNLQQLLSNMLEGFDIKTMIWHPSMKLLYLKNVMSVFKKCLHQNWVERKSHLGNSKKPILNFCPNWSILICWVTYISMLKCAK